MIHELLTLALISLLGAMSPGPDFTIVTRFAISGCRKSALLASLGIGIGILVHVTYCSLGIAVLLSESKFLFRIVQISGSLYLGYLGVTLLIKKRVNGDKKNLPKKAFASGFLINLLNPKATLFLLSLYTQFIDAKTPPFYLAVYGATIFFVTIFWFFFLSFIITHRAMIPYFTRFQKILMKGMGIVLIILALTVLF